MSMSRSRTSMNSSVFVWNEQNCITARACRACRACSACTRQIWTWISIYCPWFRGVAWLILFAVYVFALAWVYYGSVLPTCVLSYKIYVFSRNLCGRHRQYSSASRKQLSLYRLISMLLLSSEYNKNRCFCCVNVHCININIWYLAI